MPLVSRETPATTADRQASHGTVGPYCQARHHGPEFNMPMRHEAFWHMRLFMPPHLRPPSGYEDKRPAHANRAQALPGAYFGPRPNSARRVPRASANREPGVSTSRIKHFQPSLHAFSVAIRACNRYAAIIHAGQPGAIRRSISAGRRCAFHDDACTDCRWVASSFPQRRYGHAIFAPLQMRPQIVSRGSGAQARYLAESADYPLPRHSTRVPPP